MNTTEKESESPAHVNRLNSISKLKKEGFIGPDASLSESLFCYGIAWRKLNDVERLEIDSTATDNSQNYYLFIYGTKYSDKKEGYIRFDRCSIYAENPEIERNWAFKSHHSVLESNSLTIEEFREFPFFEQVNMLYSHFGSEEIFGSSYWEGFEISED